MVSTLLHLAHPSLFASQSQSQADVEHQQKVIADYLAHPDYEEEEAVSSDSDFEEPVEEDVEMEQEAEEDEDEELTEEEDAEGDIDVEAFLVAHLGGSGWEEKTAEEIQGAFMALREKLYDTELRLASSSNYVPRWGPSEHDEDEDEESGDDDSRAHLAGWLGKLTAKDVAVATKEEVLWWLVDMCKVLDGLQKLLGAV
ncbi:hypothetical protein CALVIDRAFT_534266 [Calocera viscosa TUFC12733]|uniref:Uncharacterized protein n=1 Tax=Calocera viscosa (strain TUFC12733) TaxID=1330018 RepID=A0A167PZM5_CALVF|nr:hypothetical protein CALVIDRAFT_534266 [Calocera viscosa TUFC12733]